MTSVVSSTMLNRRLYDNVLRVVVILVLILIICHTQINKSYGSDHSAGRQKEGNSLERQYACDECKSYFVHAGTFAMHLALHGLMDQNQVLKIIPYLPLRDGRRVFYKHLIPEIRKFGFENSTSTAAGPADSDLEITGANIVRDYSVERKTIQAAQSLRQQPIPHYHYPVAHSPVTHYPVAYHPSTHHQWSPSQPQFQPYCQTASVVAAPVMALPALAPVIPLVPFSAPAFPALAFQSAVAQSPAPVAIAPAVALNPALNPKTEESKSSETPQIAEPAKEFSYEDLEVIFPAVLEDPEVLNDPELQDSPEFR